MGLFDRFFYGKAGKRDYSVSDMPKTRISLFFLVLKDHLFDLIKVNLLQVIFWIPFIVWTLLSFMALQNAANEENFTASILSGYVMTWLMGLIPCISITGPSSAGAAYIMRNWSKDQHAFLWSDFVDAFRSNWKQALPVSILEGLAPVIVFAAVVFYGQLARNNPVLYIPTAAVLFVGFAFCLMLVVLYPMMVGYELTLRNLLKNAFLMAVAQFPRLLLARLIAFIPAAILLAGVCMGVTLVIFLIPLYYLLLGFALSRLIYASFANAVFDIYLNPNIEGASVRQGLRPADEEDVDETDEDADEDEDE